MPDRRRGGRREGRSSAAPRSSDRRNRGAAVSRTPSCLLERDLPSAPTRQTHARTTPGITGPTGESICNSKGFRTSWRDAFQKRGNSRARCDRDIRSYLRRETKYAPTYVCVCACVCVWGPGERAASVKLASEYQNSACRSAHPLSPATFAAVRSSCVPEAQRCRARCICSVAAHSFISDEIQSLLGAKCLSAAFDCVMTCTRVVRWRLTSTYRLNRGYRTADLRRARSLGASR